MSAYQVFVRAIDKTSWLIEKQYENKNIQKQ